MNASPLLITIGPVIILSFGYFQPFKKEIKQIHPAIFALFSIGTFVLAFLAYILFINNSNHDRDTELLSVLLLLAVCLPISTIFSISSVISQQTWYGITLTALLLLPIALISLKSILSIVIGLIYYLLFWT